MGDGPSPRIDARSTIQEIKVLGDWAFLWQHLTVEIGTLEDSLYMTREGHTLTLFQKVNGDWLLARDANLLTAP